MYSLKGVEGRVEGSIKYHHLTALNDINEPSQVEQQNEIMVVSVHWHELSSITIQYNTMNETSQKQFPVWL